MERLIDYLGEDWWNSTITVIIRGKIRIGWQGHHVEYSREAHNILSMWKRIRWIGSSLKIKIESIVRDTPESASPRIRSKTRIDMSKLGSNWNNF